MTMTRKITGILTAGLLAVSLSACASGPQQESTGQYIDSSAITTKVKTAIAAEDGLSPFAIKVKTYKGTVQLSGFVDTSAEKAKAGEVAEGVSGVDKVVNNIQVKGATDQSSANPPAK